MEAAFHDRDCAKAAADFQLQSRVTSRRLIDVDVRGSKIKVSTRSLPGLPRGIVLPCG